MCQGRAMGPKLPDDMQSVFDSYIMVGCKAMSVVLAGRVAIINTRLLELSLVS